jgi:hypothetical protein
MSLGTDWIENERFELVFGKTIIFMPKTGSINSDTGKDDIRIRIHNKLLFSVLRIRDVYPGSRILIFTHPGSRILDPKTATKERGENNFLSHLFPSHNFTKLNIISFLIC